MKSIVLFFSLIVFVFTACQNKTAPKETSTLCSLYQRATGDPQTMVLTSYKTTLVANGTDEALLRISVVDSTGLELMDAGLPFEISVIGDATLLNEDHTVFRASEVTDSISIWKSALNDGLKNFILRVGQTAGKINVEVKSDSLWAASTEIHTIPADVQLMTPTAEQLKPSQTIAPKMIGADISFLPQLEGRGMNFYDQGIEKDAIAILKDHGLNYVRLRLFVNPENEKGYSPEKGYCGLDSTLKMAHRVKDAGMKFLLDFHYSDYWADPQQQFKPKAWEGQDFEELKATLREYTKSTLLKFKDEGVLPDMVQVGNEINHGLVWPDGHISHLDHLAELLKAGVAACREVDPQIVIMMHVALGGQNQEAVFWYDNMIARGVDFDVIGLSYYPRWHGTLDDLQFNLNDLAARYHKDVNVVEYSAFKQEVHDIVFNVPENRGNGACIWEPLNTWSRVFDQQGKATESISIYDELHEKYLE